MRKETISSASVQSKDTTTVAPEENKNPIDKRNKKTTEKEAQAASPANESVSGEEDPGGALEFTVTKNHNSI